MSEYSSAPPSRPTSPLPPENQATPRPYRFNWDPASRRPGPGSVSETTEGRGGDYFPSGATLRLEGLLPSASTTSLALGAIPSEWSSSKHGFNAISTVLNNPHKQGAPPKAHSRLPAVQPVHLPQIRRKDFDHYLNGIQGEWERLERNARLAGEAEASSSQGDVLRTPRTPYGQPPAPSLPPLDTVPSVFFEPNFDLGDPRTFALVTEQDPASIGGADFSDSTALSHTLPLLDKFSHYTDTLEAHLTHEISLRSTSFFAALSNLQDLQTESSTCLSRISQLRASLKEVDEGTAKKGAKGVQLELKKDNLGVVKEGVKRVGEVWDTLAIARGLVDAGQWQDALNIIEGLEGLWEAEPPPPPSSKTLPSLPSENGRLSPLPPIPESDGPSRPTSPSPSTPRSGGPRHAASTFPLSTIQAFSALPDHLRDLTWQIATSLSSEVVSVLRLDLLARIDSTSTPKGDVEQAENDIDLTLRDRLRPLLGGLARARHRDSEKGGVEAVIESWRDVVLVEVKGVVKRQLPSGIDFDDSETQKSALDTHFKSLSQAEFMSWIRATYDSLLKCIKGIKTQNGILVEVLEGLQPRPQATPLAVARPSPVSLDTIQSSLSDLLITSAESANIFCAQILNTRSEAHSSLSLQDFCDVFQLSWDFVVNCEIACQRMIVSLRGAAVSQAKAFLQVFHQTRLTQSAKLVEDEQWSPAEVAAAKQRIADIIVDCAVRDPPQLQLSHAGDSLSVPSATDVPTSPMSPSPSNGTAGAKHLKVESQSYFAVPATLQTLDLLIDYLKLITNLSMLTTDAMSRVIEFLKAFNSRTCQVVLGAGAMRSAGLKNITAKHLALASQSLSIMISLIPYVRETFRRHLSQKQAVMLVEFDKLKRDYQEHQNEIHAKLIAIMGERLHAHIRTLQTVDWNGPKSASGINSYMELLVKETITLHKVLSRYMPHQIVEYVMTQVFAAINHRLSEEYQKIELPSQEAKDRLLADARYLHEKLSNLKNVNAPSTMLETIVQEKAVARRAESGTTANQRIKNMLASRDVRSPEKEKPLPSPSPGPTKAAVEEVPPPPEKAGFREVAETPGPNGTTETDASNTEQSPL
ncbi:Vps54-domain-containing protein [Heliocybe sulcata]|uniref:Vps54-domain-containing protein n=1 Tax=Heliocybe sulcata TaxID=5364 RepID=A0A5C3NM41_9AGAM|nr:Vps54-domain-containing protein [Heliocybe sulcata]